MHRSTPADTLHRSYDAGGSRTIIDQVDDNPLMQEMAGNFMKGESRKEVESPQNYGFSSVVRDATKGADGQILECAEGFITFLGGNRSIPICGIMDDRRYRLKQLAKGDVAVFDYLQHQFHLNNDGMFMTGRTDKVLKLQLAPPPQQQQSGGSSSGASVSALDASSGSSGGSSTQSGGGQKTLKGQTQRYQQTTKQYMQMDQNKTDHVHDKAINYKTGVHSFQPPESSSSTTYDASGYLVQIFGHKFTGGLGYFMKQVTAAPPTSAMHLTTQGYVQSIIQGLGFTMPSIPSLPMPPLPPGLTLPPGVTLPTEAEAVSYPQAQTPDSITWVEALLRRLDAIEARLGAIEARLDAIGA
jgi:phage gp45-like